MALRDLVPGPDRFLPKQVVALADAIDAGLGEFGTSFTFDGTELWDNGYWITQTGYHQHSPLARAVFSTSATSVDVNVYASASPSTVTAIQVWVNGAIYATPFLADIGAGPQTVTQSLPAGFKRVELVGGVQVIASGSIVGTYLTGCVFNQAAVILPQMAPARLVAYGDSTSLSGSGGGGSLSWPVQFRKLSTKSVVVEAASGRSLWDDTNTSPLRAAFVAKLAAMKPAVIWFLIGVNDYQANKWSAASFGTAYAATLDDLHTSLPLVKIYCQTPLYKESEVANGSGNILEDYRAQIRTICATRSTWAILIEGVALLGQAEMLSESGVYIHPNDTGNQLLAESVDKVLSGVIPYEVHASFGSLEAVAWTNTTNVSLAIPNGIQKNAGVDGSPDAGGSSTRAIANGGGGWFVRFTINETNKTRVFGVSSVGSGNNLSNIRWGFNAFLDGTMRLWQAGGGYSTGGQTYAAGDQYQIRSDGTYVYYERIRSGVVTTLRKGSITVTPSMYPLYAQGIILGSTGTIMDAHIYGILQ